MLRKLNVNHKAEIYNRYTNDKEKGFEAYKKRYQLTKTARKEERNKIATKQSQNNGQNGNDISLLTSNYCKCKWFKFSNKKTQIGNKTQLYVTTRNSF